MKRNMNTMGNQKGMEARNSSSVRRVATRICLKGSVIGLLSDGVAHEVFVWFIAVNFCLIVYVVMR
jgi:hypothetical protein